MLHHAGSMEVEELAPGLWRWSAALGTEEVWCLYVETPAATVLLDPVLPDERERFFRALERDLERRGLPLAIVCTRSASRPAADELAARYGAAILTVSPDSAER